MSRRNSAARWVSLARLSLGLAPMTIASTAHAFGDEGHRIVGEVAWRLLSEEARSGLSQSLDEPGYTSLADAATWPDTYARRFREYDAMRSYHYVNVSAVAPRYDRERDCPTGCIVTVLAQHLALLRDPEVTGTRRRHSIYWVAHLIGDLHQPLHVAHPDGRGGTQTTVSFFGEPQNLHWVWDTGLVTRASGGGARDWRETADLVFARLTPARQRAYRTSSTPEQWANESLALAKRHGYTTANAVLEEPYRAAMAAVVEEQLARAAVRLAAALDPAR